MRYVRLCKSVSDKGILVPESQVIERVDSKNDWYQSSFYYTQDHYNEFKKTGSVRGIEDVTTNKLYFDFDSKNPEEALRDAQTIVGKVKIPNGEPEIYWSGQKGFHVIYTTDKEMTPLQVASAALKLASGLKTLDLSVYNASRILRVAGTKHQKTGLYKFPLTAKELLSNNVETIKEMASSLDNTAAEFNWGTLELSQDLITLPEAPKKPNIELSGSFDTTSTPAHWRPYKWALAQGHFLSGERHQALMVIAATCRGLGYTKDMTYSICRSAVRMQSERTGSDEFPKEELYQNIIEQSIFSDNWEGGQYSPKTNPWLAQYCTRMGISVDEKEEETTKCFKIEDLHHGFLNYAKNFEQNIIKTGINEIDKNVLFLAATHNGILGAPGSGKTAFSLEFLRNASKNNVNSVFLSLDMAEEMIYAKLVQQHTGVDFRTVMKIFREDEKKASEYFEIIKEHYKNVSFNFKAGLTVADIKMIIKAQEEREGKPVKLLVTDYLECLSGPYSDATANTGFICQQLKDLANEMKLCSVILLQTQKHSTGEISDPLTSMRQIKGSSVIEQTCTAVLTLWREGYSPDTTNDDKYISFACVKNRFGPLWRDDFAWEGKKGVIHELTDEQWGELAAFKERKKLAKLEKEGLGNKQWE